jgi:hypothetical protein
MQPARIWIDLDNTPHVPFFRPLIRELRGAGHAVSISARDAFQVCSLAQLMGVDCVPIGRHHGKNKLRKVFGLLWRSLQLLPFVLKHRPTLALSHGSRSQILICNLLRIPTVMLMDYEHARTPLLLRPRWEIVPQVLSGEALQCKDRGRVRTYPGIKEDVYAPEFSFDAGLQSRLRLSAQHIVVSVRPPATEAHYHSTESDALFAEFMQLATSRQDVQLVLLPRNGAQLDRLKQRWPDAFASGRIVVPDGAVDGLSLLWLSDLVVSGGGTMNREAAALGIPVYSVFRGPIGAVDRQLRAEGRLRLLEDTGQVRSCIRLERRQRRDDCVTHSHPALATIVRHVEEIAALEAHTELPSPARGVQG